MARIRTIKPTFWEHEGMSEVSAEAALLAIGLLNYADDEGYFNANPKLIEANVFPLRELSSTIHSLLSELSKIGYIALYCGPDGRKYGHVVNFLEHQRINRASPSKIKELLGGNEPSPITHEQLSEPSHPEGKGREGKGRDSAQARRESFPDDLDTLPDDWRSKANAYWKTKHRQDLDPDDEFQKFAANHRGKGTTMADWSQAWVTWYTNAVKFSDPPRRASNIRPISEVLGS